MKPRAVVSEQGVEALAVGHAKRLQETDANRNNERFRVVTSEAVEFGFLLMNDSYSVSICALQRVARGISTVLIILSGGLSLLLAQDFAHSIIETRLFGDLQEGFETIKEASEISKGEDGFREVIDLLELAGYLSDEEAEEAVKLEMYEHTNLIEFESDREDRVHGENVEPLPLWSDMVLELRAAIEDEVQAVIYRVQRFALYTFLGGIAIKTVGVLYSLS